MAKVDLSDELEKLGKAFDRAHEYVPPGLRDELTTIRRALKRGIGELQAEKDALQDNDFNPFHAAGGLDLFEGDAQEAAALLADWARGEDKAKVARVLEAIGGGHASDLSLIF